MISGLLSYKECADGVNRLLNEPAGINAIYSGLYKLKYYKLANKLSRTHYLDNVDILNKDHNGVSQSQVIIMLQPIHQVQVVTHSRDIKIRFLILVNLL